MRIPLWLAIFLPKKTQEKSMQGRWDDKSDKSIIYAYKSSIDSFNMWSRFSEPHNDVVKNAIKFSRMKLDTYILPQMKKRNITVAPPKSKYGYILETEYHSIL